MAHGSNGHDVELGDLYRRYGAMVLRRARAILGSEAGAQDAMQEVFIRAMRAEDGFREESSPVTWLYRITTNLCLNQLRDARRRRELQDEQGPVAGASPASAEPRVLVAELLARVPEELREIAIYYYLDRMSHEEIAAVMGVSRRTVGNRLLEFREAAGVDRPSGPPP